jgi:hypothetical protein
MVRSYCTPAGSQAAGKILEKNGMPHITFPFGNDFYYEHVLGYVQTVMH